MYHFLLTFFIFISLLLIFPSMLLAKTIYKWSDEAGNVHYSDKPPPTPTSRETVDIKPAPETEQIEKVRQRENILRTTADDLQSTRLQRESQQQDVEKEKRKQQQKEAQLAQDKKTEQGKEQHEGTSEGHYQKQWQQQMPPQRLHP